MIRICCLISKDEDKKRYICQTLNYPVEGRKNEKKKTINIAKS